MSAPDALLLISSHCPHCPTVLATLADLVKQGAIGRLEVVNLEQHPDLAQTHGVRSVPWVKLGVIELAGLRSKQELTEWAAKTGSEAGMADYFHLLLKEGQMPKALALIQKDPSRLAALPTIVGNPEASLNVRLGAGVLLEEFANTDTLRTLLPRLGELSAHTDARVRADACHYLGLTGSPEARPWLEARATDEDADVREIAAESLEALPHSAL
jgi:thiol-disulfide isomerase/thioredoxin